MPGTRSRERACAEEFGQGLELSLRVRRPQPPADAREDRRVRLRLGRIEQGVEQRSVRDADLDDPDVSREPQLNTVGYLTTAAGALAAGYAIGWLTDRFSPPFSTLQMNLVAPYLDVTDLDPQPRPHYACRKVRSWAGQAAADAPVPAPAHWT